MFRERLRHSCNLLLTSLYSDIPAARPTVKDKAFVGKLVVRAGVKVGKRTEVLNGLRWSANRGSYITVEFIVSLICTLWLSWL